jgi:glutamate formiminotransferase
MNSIKAIFAVFAVFAGPALFASASSVAMLGWTSSAHAQKASGINVDTRNIAKDIAKSINVDPGGIPSVVEVPVDIAAKVCHVAANVLADQTKNPVASCTAETTSAEFEQFVQRQMKGTERK